MIDWGCFNNNQDKTSHNVEHGLEITSKENIKRYLYFVEVNDNLIQSQY